MKRVILSLMLGLVALGGVWYGLNPLLESVSHKLATAPVPTPVVLLSTATLLNPAKPITEFALIDTQGKAFTQKSLVGQWTLMFFGYAQCPGICPKTLQVIRDTWTLLAQDPKHPFLHFVFVSLDPSNDTVQNLGAFLARFNLSFIGLSGEEKVIQSLAKAIGIYSWQDPKTLDPTHTKPKIIDHSATLVLINPKGEIQALFSPPHQKEAIAQDLRSILKN